MGYTDGLEGTRRPEDMGRGAGVCWVSDMLLTINSLRPVEIGSNIGHSQQGNDI